jgi:hypothetical protein
MTCSTIEQTVEGLKALRLAGMVAALQEQQLSTAAQSLAFEERLSMLVDRELITRDNKRIERLLRNQPVIWVNLSKSLI